MNQARPFASVIMPSLAPGAPEAGVRKTGCPAPAGPKSRMHSARWDGGSDGSILGKLSLTAVSRALGVMTGVLGSNQLIQVETSPAKSNAGMRRPNPDWEGQAIGIFVSIRANGAPVGRRVCGKPVRESGVRACHGPMRSRRAVV